MSFDLAHNAAPTHVGVEACQDELSMGRSPRGSSLLPTIITCQSKTLAADEFKWRPESQ